MFTKALILVLLGSSLVLASPAADPGWTDVAIEWYNSALEGLHGAYNSALNTVDEFYEKVKANVAYAKKLTEDGLAHLNAKCNEFKEATAANIKAVSDKAAAEIDKIKNDVTKTAKVIGYETHQIVKQTEGTISQIIETAKQKWQEEVTKAEKHYAKKE